MATPIYPECAALMGGDCHEPAHTIFSFADSDDAPIVQVRYCTIHGNGYRAEVIGTFRYWRAETIIPQHARLNR